jgi:hypothetical protein
MKKWIPGLLALGALAAGAAPVFADSSGSVSARVSVAAPCIEVTPTSLDFGVLGLSTRALPVGSVLLPLTAHNCGTAREGLFARGTNATGSGGTTWTLVGSNICDGANRFGQLVTRSALQYDLTADTDVSIGTPLGGGEASTVNAAMFMPCTGSGGAGEVMSFSYVFTAVLAT